MLKSKSRNWIVFVIVFLTTFNVFSQEFTISGGGRFSVSVCSSGSIYTWGQNTAGQLGTGAGNPNVNVPTNVPIPGGVQILQADGGSGAHVLALDCNKNVWAWGLNCDGQIGNGTGGRTSFQVQTNANCAAANNVYTPVKVLKGLQTVADGGVAASPFLSDVKFISGGNAASYAIVGPNNALMSWGTNVGIVYSPLPSAWPIAGLLGNNDGTMAFSNTPVYVKDCFGNPLTNVISVDASDVSAVALTASGGVYSWGLNTNSSLGINANYGTTNFSLCATPVRTMGGGILTDIIEVTGGDQHYVAIDKNGSVWAWGGAWAGQTGVNNGGGANFAQQVFAGNSNALTGNATNLVNATAVSASQIGSAAVVTVGGNGYLYTFGGCGTYQEGGEATAANLGGQMGQNTITTCTDAVKFMEPTLVGFYDDGVGPLVPASSVNVIGVSDGDGVFYVLTQNKTTLVRSIYVMGAGNMGQLGLGDNNARARPTKLTLPCLIADPCPVATLPPDFQVCPTGISQVLTATLSPALSYTYQWSRNGTPIVGATNITYTATSLGTYSVVITRTGGGCTTCPTAQATDAVTITAYAANFGDPGDLTFCGTTSTVNVTESGSSASTAGSTYEWYAAQTGGAILATTTDQGTASLNVTTLVKTGTAPTRTATVWVEDISTFTTTLATSAQVGASSLDPNQKSGNQSRMTFSIAKALKINTIRINLRSYDASALTWSFGIYNSAGVLQGTNVPFTVGVPTGNTWATVNFNGLSLAPGNYYIQYINGNSGVSFYTNPGNAYTALYQYNGQPVIDFISADNPGVTTYFPAYVDWNVTVGSPYPCGRLAVLIDEDCPPCTKPTTVAITAPAATPTNLCQGTAQTLSGTATVAAASQNGGFTYSWRKVAPTVVVINAPTITALTVGTATAVPSNTTYFTGTVANAGTYVLRVEDGSAGDATCYTEATVVINVNPTTTPGVIAGTQTICTGGNPAAFTVTTAAAGGDGTTYAYQWEKSIGGAAYADIPGATSAIFDEGVLTNATATAVTYDYRRKVTSGACPQVTSNVITITVTPAIVAGVVATDETICNGGNPAAFTVTTGASGGTGTFTYQWESSVSPFLTYNPIAGATLATYDAPTGLTATTRYRRVVSSGTCATATTAFVTVTVQPALVAGTITAAQTICYNTAPAAFASSVAASGGTGTFVYQWQSSTDNVTFSDIVGATNATFTDATLLTANRYYRRQVTSGTITPCNVAQTASVLITVSPNFVVGTIGTAQTVCQTGDPALLTSLTLPTGGQTPYSYTWQSSPDGTTWTTIGGAISSTYDPPAGIASTTHYRRVDNSSGTCGSLNTTAVIVTVTPTIVPSVTIATPSTTICASTSITFTATPTNGGTPTYQWQKSINSGASWTNIAGQTAVTYVTTGAANNDQYRVVMTSTATCASPTVVNSNAITIIVTTVVVPAVTISAIPGNTICAGTSVTFTATPGNGGSGPTYQWKNGAANIAGQTGVSYTSSTLVNGDQISVDMVSNSGCASTPNASSNVITMVVTAVPAVSVSMVADKTTLCPSEAIVYTATPTNGGGAPTYVWKNNSVVIAGQTGSTLNTTGTAIGSPNSITVEMVSNATCAPVGAVASAPVVVTVNPVLVPSVTISASPTTICTNGSTTFTAVPTNPGAAPVYQWSINTIPVAGQTAATFTTTALTLSSDVVEVRLTSNALCANPTTATASMSVTVNTGIGAGTIGTAQTICYNTIPAAITETVPAINIAGTPTCTWEASLDGTTYATIPGATSCPSYTPTLALTANAYIRRVITDPGTPAPCNVATSNAILITVNPQLVAGVVAADEIVCSGAVATTITETTAPTGGVGTYTYQWQSSSTGVAGTFANVASAGTGSSYSPGVLTGTMYYQRVETSGSCGNVTSNIIEKTVTTPTLVSVTINDPGQTCSGTAMVFTATPVGGGATPTYDWFMDGLAVGTNSPTFNYTAAIANTGQQVTVRLTSSDGCNTGAATSNIVVLDIVNASTPTIAIATINNPNCAGLLTTFTSTSTGQGALPTYQWYVNNTPVGPNSTTFSTSTLANGDVVKVELTSSLACLIGTNPFTSNTIVMDIRPIPSPVINEMDQVICSPNSFPFTATVGTSPSTTYQWYFNNGLIPAATNASYVATQTGSYSLLEDNGVCAQTSTPVSLTIVATPIANAGTDFSIQEGNIGNLNGSGGAVYSWSPATYLSSTTVSNPSFTATETTTYILTVSNTSGALTCSSTDDVTVTVVSPIVIPNVITVNGDGLNDTWEIENIEGYPNCIIQIYNRWGNLVWKSEGYPKNWDGSNYRNGEILADGTYFYIINLQSQIYDEPYTGYIQIVK